MEPAFELSSGQMLCFHYAPVLIGNNELKHRLCKIDSNGSSVQADSLRQAVFGRHRTQLSKGMRLGRIV